MHRLCRSASLGQLLDSDHELSRRHSLRGDDSYSLSRIDTPDILEGEGKSLSNPGALSPRNYTRHPHLQSRARFNTYAEGAPLEGLNFPLRYTSDHIERNSCGVVAKIDDNFPPLTNINIRKVISNKLSREAKNVTWEWTWGDLPIKLTDPSIADLRTLTTNMALMARNRINVGNSSMNDSGSFTIDSTEPNINNNDRSLSSTSGNCVVREMSPSPHVKSDVSPESQDCARNLKANCHANGKQSQSNLNVDVHQLPSDSSTAVKKNDISVQDEIQSTTCNPIIDYNVGGKGHILSHGEAMHMHRASTAEVATALAAGDSNRVLSLCAHILSGDDNAPEPVPSSVHQLKEVLSRYAVTEHQFAKSAMEIVTNPNLVVVVNDLLIPWRLVHAHLMGTVTTGECDKHCDDVGIDVTNKGGEICTDKAASWAGLHVNDWHVEPIGSNCVWTVDEECCNMNTGFAFDDDYGHMDTLSDQSSTFENRTSYSKEGESLYYIDDSAELLNGAYGMYFKSPHGDNTMGKLNAWSKDSVNWNSSNDLTKMRFHLFKSFTLGSEEYVPDLLRPYVDASKDRASTLQATSSGCDDAKDVRLEFSGERTDNSKSKIQLDMDDMLIAPDPQSPLLQASRSHDSALDTLHLRKDGKPVGLPLSLIPCQDDAPVMPVISSESERSNRVAITQGEDFPRQLCMDGTEKKEEIDFVSLDDISPDDIRPGPPRGDIANSIEDSDTESFYSLNLDDIESCEGNFPVADHENMPESMTSRKYLYRKSLVPSQAQIKAMNLVNGQNHITFQIEGHDSVQAYLYVWPPDAKVIVADIEGALFVTKGGKSLGKLVMSLWGGSSSSTLKETHDGLAQLFNDIANNGYHFLYIATTPNASSKDDLLKYQQTSDGTGLPQGPVFLPPDTLVQSLGRERTDLYKAAALRGVRTLFVGGQHNPYHAAFGAKEKDIRAFDMCGLPRGRIFLVNESGEVSIATSTIAKRSFSDMNAMLHEIFPTICDAFSPKSSVGISSSATEDAYGDFNFWRVPPAVSRT